VSESHQPQTVAGNVGRVADSLVGGFAGSPSLLLIVVLNVAMILTGGYYMIKQDAQRNAVVIEVIGLVRACVLETSPLERDRIDQRGSRQEEEPSP
jgi:hypothetical protein